MTSQIIGSQAGPLLEICWECSRNLHSQEHLAAAGALGGSEPLGLEHPAAKSTAFRSAT